MHCSWRLQLVIVASVPNMYWYIHYIYIYIHTCVYTHIHIKAYRYLYMHACVRVYIYIYIHIHTHIHTFVYTYMRTYNLCLTFKLYMNTLGVCMCQLNTYYRCRLLYHYAGQLCWRQLALDQGRKGQVNIRTRMRTLGFHNFNLRILNLRVSNANKLIVDVCFTRCRILTCQGLRPKKQDEMSEVDSMQTRT